MTFPETPLLVRTELKIGSVWTKAIVYTRDDIVIKRGAQNEAGQASPSELSATLDNTDLRYSPRNPLGPYAGKLGLNTPLRTGLLSETLYGLVLEDAPVAATSAFAVDSAALSITGDVDIRLDLQLLSPSDWTTADDDLASKFRHNTTQRSWTLILVDGHLVFSWFPDGTDVNVPSHQCNAVMPGPAQGRKAVRITLDVDDGAGHYVLKFWTATTIAGPWTQLGSTVTGTTTTSIFDNTASVRIGANPDTSTWTFASTANCVVYAAEIRNGIDGTIVANPNFVAQPTLEPGDSYTDAAGNVWAFEAPARVGRPMTRIRFNGEISSWPPSWDSLGMNPHIPIEASGIKRRIDQGTQPVNSGLKQHLLTTSPNSYWPLDDGPTATTGANAVYPPAPFYKFVAFPPGPTAAFGAGDLGTYLPKGLQITRANNGNLLVGPIGNSSSADTAIEFVYRAEVLGPLQLTLQNNNNFDWKLQLRGDGTNNDIQLSVINFSSGSPANTDLADTAPLAAITDGQTHHVRLRLTQDGADTDYTVHLDGVQVISGTRTGHTLGGTGNVHVFYDPTGNQTPVAIGHVAAWTGNTPAPSIAVTSVAALGFAGETAGRRAERLHSELGVPFRSVGNLDNTLKMGLQYTDYFANQLTEIQATARGPFYDARAHLAQEYRTLDSLYNQAPKATLSYAAGELAGGGLPFSPVDDDQQLHNDIFVQRREGSSYQATLETGRLSVQEPPNGVGRYKDEVQLNCHTDDMLPEIGGFLLGQGTVDAARYPQLAVNLANKHIYNNPTLLAGILDTDIGDRLAVTDLDKLGIYDDISVLALGYVETLNEHKHTIVFNCAPASPFDVLEFDDADAESCISTGEDSTLLNALTSSATTLEVTGKQRTYWTNNPADLPASIMVAGEEMSVTAVAGGTAPVFVGAGTSATGNNTPVTPGLPAGAQAGDLVLVFASIRNAGSGGGTVNQPSGWTIFARFENIAILGRIYDGAWSMPTITFTGGVAGADTIAQSAAFRGVTWIGGVWIGRINGSAQNIALRSDATQVMSVDPVLVLFAGWKQDDWTTPNGADPPDGVTEIGEQVSIAGNDAGQVWGYKIVERDENIDNLSFTVTGGASAISRSIITTFLPRQIATVTRAVNSVTKAQATGEVIRLKREAGLAL